MKSDRKGKTIPVEIKEAIKYGEERAPEKEPNVLTLSNEFNLLESLFFSYKMGTMVPTSNVS